MISRGPFGSSELNPLWAKGDQGWAGTHSTGSWEEAGGQTDRQARVAPRPCGSSQPLSVPQTLPLLASALCS